MYNNRINVENGWNNVVTVTNTNIKKSEKLAESYANSAKRDMQECANYLALAQRVLRECESVKDSINTSLVQELQDHLENTDNPHFVTAEQINVYEKEYIDDFLVLFQLDENLSEIISGESSLGVSVNTVGSELDEIIGG